MAVFLVCVCIVLWNSLGPVFFTRLFLFLSVQLQILYYFICFGKFVFAALRGTHLGPRFSTVSFVLLPYLFILCENFSVEENVGGTQQQPLSMSKLLTDMGAYRSESFGDSVFLFQSLMVMQTTKYYVTRE